MKTILLDGRLVKDAEVKQQTTNNGKILKYLLFTLANNEFERNESVTTYYNVTSYNQYDIQKQETEQCYKKGRMVIVNGKPKEEMSTKDHKTYLNRYINAWRIEFGSYTKNHDTTNNTATNVGPTIPTCEVPQPTVSVPKPPTVSATSGQYKADVPNNIPTPQYTNDSVVDENGELPF